MSPHEQRRNAGEISDSKIIKNHAFHNDTTPSPEDEPLSLTKEIGLILGLEDNAYEGAYSEQGRLMTIQRFQNLPPSSEPLAFHPIEKYQNKTDFYEPIHEHDDLHLNNKDLSEHQRCNYCKEKLIKILEKNAASTKSIAKKNTADNLIHQLRTIVALEI